jgi:hypothetical protein
MTPEDLANFQKTLLEILATPSDATTHLSQLQQAELPDWWIDYIATFELPMVAVASELVQKWGKR